MRLIWAVALKELRQIQRDVETLGDGEFETPPADWLDRHSVDGNQLSLELAKIDPEVCRGSAIDEAQAHAPTPLDPEDLRIVQRAVIGEEGVVFDIVQVRAFGRGRALSAAVPTVCATSGRCWATMTHGSMAHRAMVRSRDLRRGSIVPGLQAGQHFGRIAEREIMEEDDNFLHVFPRLSGVADDQRRCE